MFNNPKPKFINNNDLLNASNELLKLSKNKFKETVVENKIDKPIIQEDNKINNEVLEENKNISDIIIENTLKEIDNIKQNKIKEMKDKYEITTKFKGSGIKWIGDY